MNPWIEAMRLRTIPVSISGVLAGAACANIVCVPDLAVVGICLLFAILAQVASNFANEYFDWRKGLDKKGREGFRRGVTEGDISPRAMLTATITTIALASLVGLSLLLWGDWWLILVGIAVAVFLLAYSAGPWPLSHHGLGDVAVLIFFGIIPVNLTAYLASGVTDIWIISLPISIAIGLMGVNVLIVNNYRDMEDDKAVGKRTTVVRFGRTAMGRVYLLNSFITIMLVEYYLYITYYIHTVMTMRGVIIMQFMLLIFANLQFRNFQRLRNESGAALNPVLASTAQIMLFVTLLLLAVSI